MIKLLPIPQDNTRQGFRLIHISDPHLSNLNSVSWQQLLNKRILGYLSWRLSRRHIHRAEILSSLVQDLDTADAHHVVISGDLTHIGTPDECKQVTSWLENLGKATDISIIPGNHDAYIETDISQTTGLWTAYMKSDPGDKPDSQKQIFPALRQRGPMAIIGVSSAVPTAPFFASGRVGEEQLARLSQILEQTRQRGLFRVVVIHHGPLLKSNKFRKRLIDSAEFRSVINSQGAELILHGHGHYPVSEVLETAYTAIPVIGVASASLLSSSEKKRSGYNIYEVNSTADKWILHSHARRYDKATGKFTSLDKQEYVLPRNQKPPASGYPL